MAQSITEITAETPCATPHTRDIIVHACYKANTLDEVDFNDPGILADIRAAFAVLAQIKLENE